MDLSLIGEILEDDGRIDELVKAIKESEEDIVLAIDSPGGDVFAGLQVVNAIQNCPHKVTAKVNVMAASMAATIALSCDAVEITKNDIMMLHNCWTIAVGSKEELTKTIDAMKAVDTVCHNIISEHCYDDSLEQQMNEGDVWLTGDQVVELFDHVELVDPPAKTSEMAATGSLSDLVRLVQVMRTPVAKVKEKAVEPVASTDPVEEPVKESVKEPVKDEEKPYVVTPALAALLARANRLGESNVDV